MNYEILIQNFIVDNNGEFENKSYKRHSDWYNDLFPTMDDKRKRIGIWKEAKTINAWLHNRLYSKIDLLCEKGSKWLTVGDGNGADAAYLLKKGCNAIASDISGDLLPVAKSEGLIEEYAVENAEKLSFADNSFDYVLCKESFHHFPRPWIAFYEMVRVAKKGIVLIEPHDPVIKMPLLLMATNIFDSISSKLMQKIWKNRYSFEPVGNFVYKISEREIEKVAIAMGLQQVAFRGFNDHYIKGVENETLTSKTYRKIKRKIALKNTLSALHIMPNGVLCAIVFKQKINKQISDKLKQQKFRYVQFPENPYLKNDK